MIIKEVLDGGGDLNAVKELYGKFIIRVMVTIYCTKNDDDYELTAYDIARIARDHNRYRLLWGWGL